MEYTLIFVALMLAYKVKNKSKAIEATTEATVVKRVDPDRERVVLGLALADEGVKYRLVRVRQWGTDLSGLGAQSRHLPSIVAVPSVIGGVVDNRRATCIWLLSNFNHSVVEWDYLNHTGWANL